MTTDLPEVADTITAMTTATSTRYFRSDPVPDDLLRRVLTAATAASNPENSQNWEFLVIRDPTLKRAFAATTQGVASYLESKDLPDDPTDRRMRNGVVNLARHIAEVPVLIIIGGRNTYPPRAPNRDFMLSAIFAAAQNLLVAARSLGLGAAFTTLHMIDEPRVRAIFGVPEDVELGVTVPLGWPARPFVPVRRRPIEEVTHYDRF